MKKILLLMLLLILLFTVTSYAYTSSSCTLLFGQNSVTSGGATAGSYGWGFIYVNSTSQCWVTMWLLETDYMTYYRTGASISPGNSWSTTYPGTGVFRVKLIATVSGDGYATGTVRGYP